MKIRQRDSSIYDSNKHFFTESADADADAGAAKQSRKASKPMMLKDVIAQQVWSIGIHCRRIVLSVPDSAQNTAWQP